MDTVKLALAPFQDDDWALLNPLASPRQPQSDASTFSFFGTQLLFYGFVREYGEGTR